MKDECIRMNLSSPVSSFIFQPSSPAAILQLDSGAIMADGELIDVLTASGLIAAASGVVALPAFC